MSDASPPSARARVAECEEAIGVISERLAEAETELAGMALRDPKRHSLRRRIAEMKADLDDARAQKAKLAPAVQAEREAEMHALRVARYQRAVAALPGIIEESASIDATLARLFQRISALVQKSEAVVAYAGLDVRPELLVQPGITAERLAAILEAKVVLFRGGLPDELPWPFSAEILPGKAAQAATVRREALHLADAILANSPDAARADRERIAAMTAERRRREEEEARNPPKQLPAPPPMVHAPAVVR